ncbi:unnamed protein product [Ectocarpus sp. CCAP 1310/34]|nr:unnamed protein product [Ectocarpus sp. CCAP 1310/34]
MQLLRIKEEEDKKAKEAAEAAIAAQGGARATPKKPTKRRQPKSVEEEEEEDEEVDESWAWSERGIPEFENTDAYKRRKKKPAAGSSASPVSLSQSAREKMPALDQFMQTIGSNSGGFAIEQVVGTCFDMNFPKEAVEVFVDKGDPFNEDNIYGMVGLTITMGLTKKTRMRKRWSTSQRHDYPLVRNCMSRDKFELLYCCRFIHCSDANAPSRLLDDGEDDPDYDSKWHIRIMGYLVLWVLIGESPVLKEKPVGFGVYIAMVNYFTDPTLFECLASHDIFAVGTCPSDRTAGAVPSLTSLGHKLAQRGAMQFRRSGEVAFMQWKDSKDVLLCSTIHIAQPGEGEELVGGGINHVKPLPLQ